jgi:hypothetical protein
LHDVGKVVLYSIPPKVRYQADDDQDGHVLDTPDRAGNQGDPLIDSTFP